MILPLDCQEKMIVRTIEAVRSFKRVLSIAPTGAGKTIIMGCILKRLLDEHNIRRAIVFSHLTTINEQNSKKIKMVCNKYNVKTFDANNKDYDCDILCAMIQSFSNADYQTILQNFDCVFIDEAHHSVANTYKMIADACSEDTYIIGVTATPKRDDGKNLSEVFKAVAYQLTSEECIKAGLNVPVREFALTNNTIKASIQDKLKTTKKSIVAQDDTLLDKTYLNHLVCHKWKAEYSDRLTIAFCTKISHARNLSDAFRKEGVEARYISSEMPQAERDNIMAEFEAGRIRVLCNVEILTEGYDCPAVSCVILAVPITTQGKFIQIRGRGARSFAGKTDCVLLDFGNTLLNYTKIEERNNRKMLTRKLLLDSPDAVTITEGTLSIEGEVTIKEEEDGSILCPVCLIKILNKTTFCPVCLSDIEEVIKQRIAKLDDERQFVQINRNYESYDINATIKWVRMLESDNNWLCYTLDRAYVIAKKDKGFVCYYKKLNKDIGTHTYFVVGAETVEKCKNLVRLAIKDPVVRYLDKDVMPTSFQLAYIKGCNALKYIDLLTRRRFCTELILFLRICAISKIDLKEYGINQGN